LRREEDEESKREESTERLQQAHVSGLELYSVQGITEELPLVHVQVLHHLHAINELHALLILFFLPFSLDLVEHLAVQHPQLHVCGGLDRRGPGGTV
jgi:hypothetical protein